MHEKENFLYDPPQLKNENFWVFHKFNWHTHTSPFCQPCATCLQKLFCIKSYDLLASDDWLYMMLSVPSDPQCPDEFHGIWWMQDNIAPETLFVFHDAEWKKTENGFEATKKLHYNWMRDPTCFGTVIHLLSWLGCFDMNIKIKNDSPWIQTNVIKTTDWLYLPIKKTELFVSEKNISMDHKHSEMLRYIFDSKTGKTRYQYRLRKIAYLTKNHKITKTSAFSEFISQLNISKQNQTSHWITTSDTDLQILNSKQILSINTPITQKIIRDDF